MAKKNTFRLNDGSVTAPRTIAAGEIIYLEYISDNKPCDKALAILLTPLTRKNNFYAGSFRTAYMIDFDKQEFLGKNGSGQVTAKISRVKDKELKAAYFEKIIELLEKEKKRYIIESKLSRY